jgi:hypothetical protein
MALGDFGCNDVHTKFCENLVKRLKQMDKQRQYSDLVSQLLTLSCMQHKWERTNRFWWNYMFSAPEYENLVFE